MKFRLGKALWHSSDATSGYAYDDEYDNPWLVQRRMFILAGRNGIVDDKEKG